VEDCIETIVHLDNRSN
jgi:hypothetical protein